MYSEAFTWNCHNIELHLPPQSNFFGLQLPHTTLNCTPSPDTHMASN